MMNNSNNGYFQFDSISMVKLLKLNLFFGGMATMMSQEVQMNAH